MKNKLSTILLLLFMATTFGCGGEKQSAPLSEPIAPVEKVDTAPAPEAEQPPESDTQSAGDKDTGPSVASSGFDPLPPSEREIFFGSTMDKPAEVLLATRKTLEGRHYLYSDEENPQKFYKSIKDLGGAYVGVGTDQGYLFIGWMKPKLAWLTDYDQWVVFLHRAYFAFFEAAEDRQAFLKFWEKNMVEDAVALLEKKYDGDENKERIVNVFKHSQPYIRLRLRRMIGQMNKHKIPSFMNDDENYLFVRSMVVGGRVRPMIGNLFANVGLKGVAETAKALDVPVRAFYLSNAEDYWPYPENFRENLWSMHFDEKSLIMRATASKPRNGDYIYSVQPAFNFQKWLREPYVKRVRDIWRAPHVDSEDHYPFEFFDKPPKQRKR